MHEANRVGLTRVHSAGQDFEYLDLYNELRNKGDMSLSIRWSFSSIRRLRLY